MQIFVLHTRRRLHGSVLRVCVCIEKLCTWPSKSNKLVLLSIRQTTKAISFYCVGCACPRMGVWECAWVWVCADFNWKQSKLTTFLFCRVLWFVLIEMRGWFGQFSIRIERKVKRKMLNDCRKVFHSFSNLVQHVLANFSGYAMENLNFSCALQTQWLNFRIQFACHNWHRREHTQTHNGGKSFSPKLLPVLAPFHSLLPLSGFSPLSSLLLFCFFRILIWRAASTLEIN